MKTRFEIQHRQELLRRVMTLLLAAVFLPGCVLSVAAQQKDKKKKKDETPATDSSKMVVPMTDEQQIDYMLSEMLGAWQVGDVEKLHAKYADDVYMVTGSWAPPVIS